ncbi:MAG: hypothetical protein ACHQ50_15585 [Fimbriimonadales bacterium]
MRLPRLRFTVRSLMIAVVVVAGLLALPTERSVIVIALSVPCLALIGGQWLVFQGHRHLAAFGFWVLATLTNVLYAAACVAPDSYLLPALFLGWLVIVAPTIGGLGAAWAILATREGAVPRRSPPTAWLSVIALSVMPLATLCTLWPLHLAVFTARPALELLADQVAAGQAPGFPRRAGLFWVAGSAVDTATGNVGLMIDPNPNGPTGFVRVSPGTPLEHRFRPIGADDLEVDLGGGWWYHEED